MGVTIRVPESHPRTRSPNRTRVAILGTYHSAARRGSRDRDKTWVGTMWMWLRPALASMLGMQVGPFLVSGLYKAFLDLLNS
jgi:hypothetical protein